MTVAFARSAAIVLVLAGLNAPALAQEPDIAGRYRCEGVNPDGGSYRSVVEIDRDDQTYIVRWVGREPALGIGILRDGHLSVAYTNGRATGVIVYRIERGPRLTGQWTVLGADGRLYEETLTKIGLAARRGGDTPGIVADLRGSDADRRSDAGAMGSPAGPLVH